MKQRMQQRAANKNNNHGNLYTNTNITYFYHHFRMRMGRFFSLSKKLSFSMKGGIKKKTVRKRSVGTYNIRQCMTSNSS